MYTKKKMYTKKCKIFSEGHLIFFKFNLFVLPNTPFNFWPVNKGNFKELKKDDLLHFLLDQK